MLSRLKLDSAYLKYIEIEHELCKIRNEIIDLYNSRKSKSDYAHLDELQALYAQKELELKEAQKTLHYF